MEVLPTIKCEPELNIGQEVDESVTSISRADGEATAKTRFVNGNDPSAVVSFQMDEEDDLNENWQHPIDEESYEDSEEFISIDDDKAKSFLFNAMKSRSEVSTDGDDTESGMFLEPEIVLESNDNEEIQFLGPHSKSEKSVSSDDDGDVIIIDDDSGDEIMYEDPEDIDENEDGVELNWMDLENNHDDQFEFGNLNLQKGSKDSSKDPNGTEFECHLCNKKVASSYNLRRHMMIHTGKV